MKKFLNLFLVYLVAFQMNATGYSALEYLSMDFSDSPDGHLYGGWTCRGAGKTPAEEVTENFNIQSGDPAYVIIDVGDLSVAFSNSTTMEGGLVDEWLVSPATKIDSDNAMLTFYVAAFGSLSDSNYEVYVSTTGNSHEDFNDTPIYSGTITGHTLYAQTELIHIPLEGYKDKEIYVAFVNKSIDAMLTGFSNISVADYTVDVTNLTDKFVYDAGNYEVALSAKIITPVECAGFKAELKTSDGLISEYEETENLHEGYFPHLIEFPDAIDLTSLKTVDYTITITPNYDNAKPLVLDYSISYAEAYPKVVVMENATGAWNPYSTYACAAIDKYKDTYGDYFIPIEVHYYDGMQVDNYYPHIFEMTAGLSPLAVLNRADVADTWDEEAVKKILAGYSPMQVDILDTSFDTDTQKGYVKFAPTFGCDISSINLSAAVIIREDNCTGTGTDWTQLNNLNGATSATQVGVSMDWWPYLQPYCRQDYSIVGFEFDNVAWGIFNNFEGSENKLPSTWKHDESQEFTISFDLPTTIQNIENTSVVVAIVDNDTKEIITADFMYARDFSSTQQIFSDDSLYNVDRQGNNLIVNAQAGTHIDLFTANGLLIKSYIATEKVQIIDGSNFEGVIFVRLSNKNYSAVEKSIW